MYMEGQPERDLRKELRVQERRQRREERQARCVRELEEVLVQKTMMEKRLRLKRRNLQDFLKGRCLFHRKQRRKKS